jgi:uncharacterized membrane protein
MASPRPNLTRHLRKLFLGGLVVLVPIVLTVNALVWLFHFVDGLTGPLAEAVVGRAVPGVGFVTTVAILGDVVVLPASDVIETDLSVEDGVSLMLSAGASVPRVASER